MGLILEGIVTTLDADRELHLTAMGPVFESADAMAFELRPYEGSRTLANLTRSGQGVLHVTDDVALIARSALGGLETLPRTVPAERVDGRIVADACRWYEFEVTGHQVDGPRHRLACRTVALGRGRDFWGFNRARHALIEAAILLSRADRMEPQTLRDEFARLAVPIDKTAGAGERELWAWLCEELARRTTTPSGRS